MIKNINSKDYNEIFTNEGNFCINQPIKGWYTIK